MIARVAAIALCSASTLMPGLARAQTDIPAELLPALLQLRAQDCVLLEDGEDAFLEAVGLSQSDIEDALRFAVIEGLVTVTLENGGEARLIPALCDPAGHGDMRATLTAAVRMNGCSMSEDEAEATLPAFGLDESMTRDVAQEMVASGEISLDLDVVTLSTPLCEGANGIVPSPRGVVLTALRAAACTLDEESLASALVAAGYAPEMAPNLLSEVAADGSLAVAEGIYSLDAAICAGTTPAPDQPAAPVGAAWADPVAWIVTALRETPGCTANEDSLEPMLELFEELLPYEVMEVAEGRFEGMMMLGDITERGDIIALSAGMCAGEAGRFHTALAQLQAEAGPNGCALPGPQVAGASDTEAMSTVMRWIEESALAEETGTGLTLDPEVCRIASPEATAQSSDPEPVPAPEPAPSSGLAVSLAALGSDTAAFEADRAMRAAGCTMPLGDRAGLEALATGMGTALGASFGTDPATDAALLDLAVRGLRSLIDSGKAVWDAGTQQMRLTTC